jgi:hypothetical protein
MADIALRSPQFKYIEIPATGVLSTVCTITINQAATPVYTLTKNVAPSTTAYFDISELVRDYFYRNTTKKLLACKWWWCSSRWNYNFF